MESAAFGDLALLCIRSVQIFAPILAFGAVVRIAPKLRPLSSIPLQKCATVGAIYLL